MIILLDTHTVLWFLWDDPQLSTTAKASLCDPANRKLVSPASAWEVAIKLSLKKLDIGGPYRGFFPQQMLRTNFEWLPITDDHFAAVSALPFHHKDPFDRLLVAQAAVEGIPIVSADSALGRLRRAPALVESVDTFPNERNKAMKGAKGRGRRGQERMALPLMA